MTKDQRSVKVTTFTHPDHPSCEQDECTSSDDDQDTDDGFETVDELTDDTVELQIMDRYTQIDVT